MRLMYDSLAFIKTAAANCGINSSRLSKFFFANLLDLISVSSCSARQFATAVRTASSNFSPAESIAPKTASLRDNPLFLVSRELWLVFERDFPQSVNAFATESFAPIPASIAACISSAGSASTSSSSSL